MNNIIDNTQNNSCYKCLGTGYAIGPGVRREQAKKHKCKFCNGTGIYKDTHFIITGNGIAIDSDMQGK